MEQAEAEQRVGTTLCEKWTLLRLLGVGGMAAVYESSHKIGRRDALKILHPEVARIGDLRHRFELEAHVANSFKHPGAVEIRDIDTTDDGCPFLVMELLEGETLSERARRVEITEDDLLRFTDELLDVLVAAHGQGIIHRDIKLDNLFVTTAGPLKVLDFGIARIRGAIASSARTAIGSRLGTTPYMPPEQAAGRDVDGRADLFAVGATMFRLVARRRIHESETESGMLAKMATQPAPPLATVANHASQGVCLVVDRALQFRREDRYPDAATMQRDVRDLRAGRSPTYATERLLSGVVSSGNAPLSQPVDTKPFLLRPSRETDTSPAAASVLGAAAVTAFASDSTSAASPSARAVSVQHPLLGTLKSAGVVALPGAAHGEGEPPSSRSFVAVEDAPPQTARPKTPNKFSLILFGGAFVLIGIGLTLWIAWPGERDGSAAQEDDEARRAHAAKPPPHEPSPQLHEVVAAPVHEPAPTTTPQQQQQPEAPANAKPSRGPSGGKGRGHH